MKEIFKTIEYRGTTITVSNLGTIIWNGNKRKWYYNSDNYACVSIKITPINKNDEGWRSIQVHRLVALAFIPNPNNLPEVNHKDYNRRNPRLDNLEWITHIDNIRYSKCNRPDYSGEKNPNYNNNILHKKYINNKELSKIKQGRPGEKNGRSTPVDLYYDDILIKSFSYIIPCCQYLIDIGVANSKKVESVRGRLNDSYKTGKKYKKHYSIIKK